MTIGRENHETVKRFSRWKRRLLLGIGLFAAMLGSGIVYVQSGSHSLAFLKPWMLRNLNHEGAPYQVAFEDVTFDWQSLDALGEIRVSEVVLSRPGGKRFARLPDVYVTLDPFGFLPSRHIIRSVILHAPRVRMAREEDGQFVIGIDDDEHENPLPIRELIAALQGEEVQKTADVAVTEDAPENDEKTEHVEDAAVQQGNPGHSEPVDHMRKKMVLPFQEFHLSEARVRLYDRITDTELTSKNAALHLRVRDGVFSGEMDLPFLYRKEEGRVRGELQRNPKRSDYSINLFFNGISQPLACKFFECPKDVTLEGKADGTLRLGLHPDGAFGAAWAQVNLPKATLTAPQWFAEPLVLIESGLRLGYDHANSRVTLESLRLGLEDTTLTLSGHAQQRSDGWHASAQGETTRLTVDKIYRYWPLFMAPESRLWVVSKLKSGHAERGTIAVNLRPEDFTAETLRDDALKAQVAARGIGFEYLPGFPPVQGMDGDVVFTGTTITIDGRGGRMLQSTEIPKALLRCTNLNHPNNPMEVQMHARMSASDLVTLLSQKPFTFDDDWGLDAKTASGEVEANLALKFNSFSNQKGEDDSAIHFEAVTYDIQGNIRNFSQPHLLGGYDIRNINAAIRTSNASTHLKGTFRPANAALQQFELDYREDKPLKLTLSPAEKGKPANDFTLTYARKGAAQHITLTGKRIDTTLGEEVASDEQDSHWLKEFPSLVLTLEVDELQLVRGAAFKQVKGALDCGEGYCQSARFQAAIGNGRVEAGITTQNEARVFRAEASNAGEFLRDLDVTDRMQGGVLSLNGTFAKSRAPAAFSGRLLISAFTLRQSELLGRIFAIGSLSGLSNALTGSGIAFEKLAANLELDHGVLTIRDGKASGNAMGMTARGEVDMVRHRLDVKGVIAPAYALNSLLGNIPIIGAIAGGEEGLIAFNYGVSGALGSPEVSVNPLSGLTPGFLRGIFGIFDGDTKADAPAAESETQSKEKKKSTP